MYVTNVQGCARARSGTNPNVGRKRGSTKIVIWKRKTTRLATNNRRTQGVMPKIRCGPIYAPRRTDAQPHEAQSGAHDPLVKKTRSHKPSSPARLPPPLRL